MVKNVVNIGLLGLGTVGIGVVKVTEKLDNLNISKIAVRNISKARDVNFNDKLTVDAYQIINDPSISIIVEVIGGVEPAFEYITNSIKNGKHIVTANKELIAKKGAEIFALADKHNVRVLYEASVGGGIPLVMPLKQSLAANKVGSIAGILNGTTNYILTKMELEKAEFFYVLAEAQRLGYAEADPTSDVEGHDAAYKLSILASIAYEQKIDVSKIYCEGISKVSPVDINYAQELGYKIKLIAMAKDVGNNMLDVRVHPSLVSIDHPLASISGVTNALTVNGDAVGEVNFSGPGAGQLPTASAVVGDVLALVSDIKNVDNILPSMKSHYDHSANILPMDDTTSSFYVRVHAKDMPGVIGSMGTACGNHGVSLSGVIQKDMLDNGSAVIILLTHEVKESAMRAAIEDISKQISTDNVANIIRVFK